MSIVLPEDWEPDNLKEAEKLPPGLRDARVYVDLTRFDGHLWSFANKVKGSGIVTKGQLVAVGADQLLGRIKTSPGNQGRVRAFLATLQA